MEVGRGTIRWLLSTRRWGAKRRVRAKLKEKRYGDVSRSIRLADGARPDAASRRVGASARWDWEGRNGAVGVLQHEATQISGNHVADTPRMTM